MIGRLFNRLRGRRWLEIVIPCLLLVAAVLVCNRQPAVLTHMQNLVWDNYQRSKPRIYQPLPVRIVDIDEDSLARLGQWPWPRTEVARLVDRLTETRRRNGGLGYSFLRTRPHLAEEFAELLWPGALKVQN